MAGLHAQSRPSRPTYTNDPRLIGDRSGIKVGGSGTSSTFAVAATTVERTPTYYIGGWNATGRVTVSLPGAPTYTTTFSSATTFSRVFTVRFRADAPTTMTVIYTKTAGPATIRTRPASKARTGTSGARPCRSALTRDCSDRGLRGAGGGT